MQTQYLITPTLALLVITACGVRSTAPQQEGLDATETSNAGSGDAAVQPKEDAGSLVKPPADAGAQARPARGFYIFSSNYEGAASVGAVGLDGKVVSESLISSGSDIPGLSLGLSADIVPPTQVQDGDEVVIIDRSNNAIDWLALDVADIAGQMGVGPGEFAANPYDYWQVDETRAFVTRFETNGAPGEADLDEGGDLLVINPKSKKLVGRVDFNHLVEGEDGGLQPRPSKLVGFGGKLQVVLGMLTDYFAAPTQSLLATVDPDTLEITSTIGLGLRNCEDISVSLDSGLAAIACKGDWADVPLTKNSGIVLVDLAGDEPELQETLPAAELADAQVSTLAFASPSMLVFSTYGNFDDGANDRALVLDLERGTVSDPILETTPFQMGHIRCAPEEKVCVIANADTFGVEFFTIEGSSLEHSKTTELGADLGLPPRYIGVF